jgi:hypothetical protein
MSAKMSRRTFVTNSMLASAGAAIAAGPLGTAPSRAADNSTGRPSSPAPQGALPQGKIGDLEVSRLLLGGNLLTHYTHSRDLRYVNNLAKNYNTQEKILDTLALAEQHGINTLVIHNVPATMKILVEHRRRGGKMQWITCTAHALANGDLNAFCRQIDELVDYGTDALYVSGVEADRMCGFHKGICGPDADDRVAEPRLDVLQQALFAAKAHGLPVGIGAHRMGVIETCETAGLEADFYVKTFHQHTYASVDLNHDSRWCSRPEELAAFMQTVDKPWIAFKVMAAGAIPPESAFRHSFQQGADFVLAGMFDFEIEQDVRIARQVLAGLENRARPWRA